MSPMATGCSKALVIKRQFVGFLNQQAFFKLQNPLRQNYEGLKALETTVGANPHLHSVVTFVGGSIFKI